MLTTGYSKGFPTGGALSFSVTGGVRCIGGFFMVVGSFLVLATRTNSFKQVDFGVPTSRVKHYDISRFTQWKSLFEAHNS
jgi:hypothetical protein